MNNEVIRMITGAKVRCFSYECNKIGAISCETTPYFDVSQKIELYSFGPAATIEDARCFRSSITISDLQRQVPYRPRCPRTS